jgi:molybdopterin converting factor small subunit
VDEIDVPAGSSVADVWSRLVAEYPRLAGQRYRPAVNQEYVGADAPLADGDEVVFIPPVSGGTCLAQCVRCTRLARHGGVK